MPGRPLYFLSNKPPDSTAVPEAPPPQLPWQLIRLVKIKRHRRAWTLRGEASGARRNEAGILRIPDAGLTSVDAAIGHGRLDHRVCAGVCVC